jgi:hypothetical protein
MAGVVDIDEGADSWLPVPIAPPQIRRGRLANAGEARLRPQAKLENVAETGRHQAPGRHAVADMCHLALVFVHMFVGCDGHLPSKAACSLSSDACFTLLARAT